MRRGRCFVPILLVVLGIVTSCSKDLSRSQAQDLITGNEDFSRPHTIEIPVGNLWWDSRSIGSIESPDVRALEQSGVLTFRKSGRSSWIYIEIFSELTPLGKDVSKSWTLKQKDLNPGGVPCNGTTSFCAPPSHADLYSVAVTRRQFKRVTGIRLDSGGKEATADFEFGWSPTDDGKVLKLNFTPDRVFPGHAAFQLYDDGWRLSTIQLH
jgi:hypothetical protein